MFCADLDLFFCIFCHNSGCCCAKEHLKNNQLPPASCTVIQIQIHLFIKITWFQHGLIHWDWHWTIVEFYPCLLLITVDMEILIKVWSRCHKDHYKWKRSDSPCNTGCITVFRTRCKHMWPRALNTVGRVIYIAFNWALMRMKRRPVLLFYNQSMASDDEKMAYIA